MITEIALIEIKAGTENDYEAAIAQGHGPLFAARSIQRALIESSMARLSTVQGTGWPVLVERAIERARAVVFPILPSLRYRILHEQVGLRRSHWSPYLRTRRESPCGYGFALEACRTIQ